MHKIVAFHKSAPRDMCIMSAKEPTNPEETRLAGLPRRNGYRFLYIFGIHIFRKGRTIFLSASIIPHHRHKAAGAISHRACPRLRHLFPRQKGGAGHLLSENLRLRRDICSYFTSGGSALTGQPHRLSRQLPPQRSPRQPRLQLSQPQQSQPQRPHLQRSQPQRPHPQRSPRSRHT